MGTLSCAGSVVEFDDRVLTHLQIVIIRKFRNGEAFSMSWLDGAAIGDGRASMWLTPSMPVVFKFYGSRIPAIDQGWIDRLTASADGPRGLIVTDADGVLVKASGVGHHPLSSHSVR
jgi:hypothetical protein